MLCTTTLLFVWNLFKDTLSLYLSITISNYAKVPKFSAFLETGLTT